MQHYNNKGNSRSMTAKVNDGLWTFTGKNLRFKGGFNGDGGVFSGVWEQLTDRKTWSHLIDQTLQNKIKPIWER